MNSGCDREYAGEPTLRWIFALFVVVLLSSSLEAQAPKRGGYSERIAAGDQWASQRQYDKALREWKGAFEIYLPELRGKRFLAEVRPGFMKRPELSKFIREELDREMPPIEFERMRKAFVALGLAKPTFRPGELLPRLYTEEIAGFYDPRKKTLFLIAESEGTPFDSMEQKITLVHEMSHALMDQHYDLEAMQRGVLQDDDALVALTSLVEGEATAAMFAYAAGGKAFLRTPPSMAGQMFPMDGDLAAVGGPALRDAPKIIVQSLIFPYGGGLKFVLDLTHRSGDWTEVDRAFRAPPISTEQILHPEKYRNGDDPPMRCQLVGVVEAAGDGWKEVTRNTLGELGVSILLEERGARGAERAAAGWGGDRYLILEGPDGQLAVVVRTLWDTERDAQQFARSWRRSSPKAKVIRSKGREVLVIEGIPEERRAAVEAAASEGEWYPKRFPVRPPSRFR